MGTEKKLGPHDTVVEENEAQPEPAHSEEQRKVEERLPRPGEILEPKEKSWDAEPANPYDGIDRSDPFEGRPRSKVAQPKEIAVEPVDPATTGPGQPLSKKHDPKT